MNTAQKESSSVSISELFEELVAKKIQPSNSVHSDNSEESSSGSISELFERLVAEKI